MIRDISTITTDDMSYKTDGPKAIRWTSKVTVKVTIMFNDNSLFSTGQVVRGLGATKKESLEMLKRQSDMFANNAIKKEINTRLVLDTAC